MDGDKYKNAYEMKAWNRIALGTFYVPKGKQVGKLKAVDIKHKNVAELSSLRLKLLEK